jgi:thiol-disulfide isomerase/thioredoxin
MNNLKRLGLSAFAVAAFATCALASLGDSNIGPGSPAPSLDVKKWFKGSPVTSLDPSKTYVVEFWATWCGPCIQSIPHLTEIAKKNPDVTFIGVSIWEDDKDDNIANFINGMGDKMDYHVAYSGNQTGMAKSWMAAAGQNGIPSAFIAKGGNIQWVGHPMEIEKPLEEVKAGTFDLPAFKAKFDVAAEKARKQMATYAELDGITKLYDAGSKTDAKKKLDALVARQPEVKSQAESIKFGWLAKEDPTVWMTKATEMAKVNNEQNRRALLSFALSQARPNGNLALGHKALELVMTATKGKDLNTLLYANAFYGETKEYSLALDAVNQALEIVPADNTELRTSLEKTKKEVQAKALQQKSR